jgi:hypothetical protein
MMDYLLGVGIDVSTYSDAVRASNGRFGIPLALAYK